MKAWMFALFLLGAAPSGAQVVGELHIEHFRSTVFGDPQTLRIWLPPGYHDPANAARVYPVLYLLDGQNLFDAKTATFGTEWQVDETLTRLIGEGRVRPLIVVGIDSPGDRRTQEYAPYPDPVYLAGLTRPQGQLFPAFMTDDVLPLVQREYRVAQDPSQTAIGGSSYGAVAALYTLLHRPDRFGLGLLESTSLQIGNGQLLRDVTPLVLGPQRISIGVGEEETGDPERAPAFVELSRELAEALRRARFNHPAVLFTAQPGAHHQEKYWAERFPAAITFLFPAPSPVAPAP